MADERWMERWRERQAEPDHPARAYRVEHRDAAETRCLGVVTGVPAHRATLDPFLSRLLQAGAEDGELVLVDEATGAVVARRPVRRAPRAPRRPDA